MWLNRITNYLCAEAERVTPGGLGATWFLFGSVTSSSSGAKDVDLLVVCDSHETAQWVRAELALACMSIPLHLVLLTKSEEIELGFVDSEECIQIFPKKQQRTCALRG